MAISLAKRKHRRPVPSSHIADPRPQTICSTTGRRNTPAHVCTASTCPTHLPVEYAKYSARHAADRHDVIALDLTWTAARGWVKA